MQGNLIDKNKTSRRKIVLITRSNPGIMIHTLTETILSYHHLLAKFLNYNLRLLEIVIKLSQSLTVNVSKSYFQTEVLEARDLHTSIKWKVLKTVQLD